jgi:quinol-cytochrome oxidoreductase complex cytochrome b subunit
VDLLQWLERTFGVIQPHRDFLKRPLPPRVGYAYCLGGVALCAALLSALTGMLLSLYYVPSAREAYQSVVLIHQELRLGWLVRSTHKWSGNVLIVFILLHTIRVVVSRAYRPPRELNWVAGALSFLVVLAMGFTGYLLPWDQRAYWATVVGTSMASTVPVVGESLVYLLRGGDEVGGVTLIRFYSLHVLWLPLMLLLLLWAHFHMVKRLGIAAEL